MFKDVGIIIDKLTARSPDKADVNECRKTFFLRSRHNPGMPDILFNRGVILFMKKNFDSAEQYFTRVPEMLPFLADVWKHRGNIEFRKGNREKTLEYYSLSIKYGIMNNRSLIND